jgi:hypothetical protein
MCFEGVLSLRIEYRNDDRLCGHPPQMLRSRSPRSLLASRESMQRNNLWRMVDCRVCFTWNKSDHLPDPFHVKQCQ